MQVERVIDDFFSWSNTGYKSKYSYRIVLRQFLLFIQVEELEEISLDHMARFLADQHKKGFSDATVRTKRSIIRKFMNYLKLKNVIRFNRFQMDEIQLPRSPTYVPPSIKEDDFQFLYEYFIGKSFLINPKMTATKYLAIFLLFRDTGIRVSEMCNLNRSDFHLFANEVSVKGRSIYYAEETKNTIYNYWRYRDMISRAVRCAFSGREVDTKIEIPISARTIENFFSRVCTQLEIEPEITPHSLRHRLVRKMMKEGIDDAEITRIMGFSSVAVIQAYRKKDPNSAEHKEAFAK